MFKNKNKLDLIAEKITELHNSQIKDCSTLNTLEQDRDKTQIALNNLLDCMERGIATETTKRRILELDQQLAELNKKLSQEKTKDKKPPVSKKEVVDYISNNLTNTPEALVQLLIKKVIIYDDKVEIYYNYTNEKDTLDLLQECPFYIDKISRTIKNTKINGEDYELIFEIKIYF